MLASICSPGTLFGKWRGSMDSALANMLNGIGRMDSGTHRVRLRYNGTLHYGGLERTLILRAGFLILPTLRGIASFCWLIRFAELGLMIDLLEMKLSGQWKES